MTKGLRWENPRSGRDGFDERAGREWQYGPDPNDITGSIPDGPWNRRKTEPGNRLLFESGQWAVTTFGLERLYFNHAELYEPFAIPAARLLDVHERGRVHHWPVAVARQEWVDFDTFEEAFKKAIEIHHRGRSSGVDDQILETSFRRARGMLRRSCKRRPAA